MERGINGEVKKIPGICCTTQAGPQNYSSIKKHLKLSIKQLEKFTHEITVKTV